MRYSTEICSMPPRSAARKRWVAATSAARRRRQSGYARLPSRHDVHMTPSVDPVTTLVVGGSGKVTQACLSTAAFDAGRQGDGIDMIAARERAQQQYDGLIAQISGRSWQHPPVGKNLPAELSGMEGPVGTHPERSILSTYPICRQDNIVYKSVDNFLPIAILSSYDLEAGHVVWRKSHPTGVRHPAQAFGIPQPATDAAVHDNRPPKRGANFQKTEQTYDERNLASRPTMLMGPDLVRPCPKR